MQKEQHWASWTCGVINSHLKSQIRLHLMHSSILFLFDFAFDLEMALKSRTKALALIVCAVAPGRSSDGFSAVLEPAALCRWAFSLLTVACLRGRDVRPVPFLN